MVVTGFILLALAFIVAGYMLSSRLAKTVESDDQKYINYGMDFDYSPDVNVPFEKAKPLFARPLTPKEYGERFGTGASKNKKTNRLKLRR